MNLLLDRTSFGKEARVMKPVPLSGPPPRVTVVVSSLGSAVEVGKSLTYRGTATVHDDDETKQWFFGALAARRFPHDEEYRLKAAAAEQRVPGHSEVIEWEDAKGKWHTESAAGMDRPNTAVKDTKG